MFHMGLADMCNIFCQALAGILLITGWAYSLPYRLNQFYGAVHNSFSWFWYITLCHVVAFNRCVTICLQKKYTRLLFSEKATTIWLLGCFLHGAVWFAVQLTPKCSFILIPELYTFYFDHTYAWYKQVKEAAWWAEMLLLNTSVMWYFIIYIYLKIKTKRMLTVQSQINERQILYQVTLICGYVIIWNQYWHLAPKLYEEYNFKYAFYVGNLLWLSNSAVNPLVYFTLNKTIKAKVRAMFQCRLLSNGYRPTSSSTQLTNGSKSLSSNRNTQLRLETFQEETEM